MKGVMSGVIALAVVIGFALLVGHAGLAFGLALFGAWFTVAWFRRESVIVDE